MFVGACIQALSWIVDAFPSDWIVIVWETLAMLFCFFRQDEICPPKTFVVIGDNSIQTTIKVPENSLGKSSPNFQTKCVRFKITIKLFNEKFTNQQIEFSCY